MNKRVVFDWLIAFSVFAGGVALAQQPSGVGSPGAGSVIPAEVLPSEADFGPSPAAYYPPGPGLYEELLPQDRGGCYDVDSRRDLNFRQMLRGSWFRLEYMHGDIHKYDEAILGAVPAQISVPDPSDPTETITRTIYDLQNPYPVLFPDGETYVWAQVPTSGNIDWHDVQGMRASFGIPVLDKVWIEASFMGYAEVTAQLNVPDLPANYPYAPGEEPTDINGDPINPIGTGLGPNGTNIITLLATTYLVNGGPSSVAALYDAGFVSQYDSQYRAGNIDVVFNWRTPQYGFRAQPILGYRHEEYTERLAYTGTFSNVSGYFEDVGVLDDPWTDTYDSRVKNQRDQVELGLRTELSFPRLTLGVQEKFGLGVNTVRGTVLYDNTFDFDDTGATYSSVSHDSQTRFAPTFDLDVYATVKLTNWMNFRVGYNLLWLGSLGAADQSIRYNSIDDGTTSTLDVTSDLNYSDRVISALTLGGEIILP